MKNLDILNKSCSDYYVCDGCPFEGFGQLCILASNDDEEDRCDSFKNHLKELEFELAEFRLKYCDEVAYNGDYNEKNKIQNK